METNNKNSEAESSGDGDTIEKKIELETQQQSAQIEELIRELIDMGFPRASVVQIVNNALGVPKDLIVEQLLSSNSKTDDLIPVVDDDGDEMWEDVTVHYKMVIVINTGLNMGIGKMASQAAHAALGLYEVIKEKRPDLSSDMNIWNEQGSRKIVVEAKNTTELIKLSSRGTFHHIPFFCVHDAGLTEVTPNSFTALAFFGSNEQLKPVTGKLRLLK